MASPAAVLLQRECIGWGRVRLQRIMRRRPRLAGGIPLIGSAVYAAARAGRAAFG